MRTIALIIALIWPGPLSAEGTSRGHLVGESVAITFRPKVAVAGARVYLSDIARCSGSHDICRQAPGIDVGASPLPGRTAFINRSAIDPILEKEFPGVTIEWGGDDACRIEAVAGEAPIDEIKSQLQNAVNLRSQVWRDDGRVSITRVQATIASGVRPTQTKIEFTDLDQIRLESLDWVSRNLAGTKTLQIRIVNPKDQDDRTTAQIQVTFNVERRLPVLKSSVVAGDVVAAKNVTDAWIPMRRGFQDFITDGAFIAGKRARQSIMAGDPVPPRFLDQPIVITRNQQVTLVVRKGDLEITGRATTVDQGPLGATVEVINVATKKRMRARIIDERTVEAVAF
jgi:flagella basal body P-ring formation protein FlgA